MDRGGVCLCRCEIEHLEVYGEGDETVTFRVEWSE